MMLAGCLHPGSNFPRHVSPNEMTPYAPDAILVISRRPFLDPWPFALLQCKSSRHFGPSLLFPDRQQRRPREVVGA